MKTTLQLEKGGLLVNKSFIFGKFLVLLFLNTEEILRITCSKLLPA